MGTAQDDSPSGKPHVKPDQPMSLRVNSDLVLIPVTVLDRDGRPMAGLQKDSFTLFDDRAQQLITHFDMEDAPVSIGFVFDTSASMRSKMQKARELVTTFLKTANLEDEFFLVQFSDRVDLAVDLTKDAEELQRQLLLMQAAGRTALLDAIHFSISRMRTVNNVRKALIIVSDGGDNCSRYTKSELKSLVREADVQIYVVGIFDPQDVRSQTPEEALGPGLLQEMAKQSGGRLFEIENINQLPELASKIGAALRAQYVLGYSPTKTRRDGKYHRVEVKLAQPRGFPKLQASWRRGYYSRVE
jgi:VWFA-related protein